MSKENIIEYIKTNHESFSKSQIKSELVKAGYDSKQVDDSYIQFESEKSKKLSKTTTIILSLVMFIFFVVMYILRNETYHFVISLILQILVLTFIGVLVFEILKTRTKSEDVKSSDTFNTLLVLNISGWLAWPFFMLGVIMSLAAPGNSFGNYLFEIIFQIILYLISLALPASIICVIVALLLKNKDKKLAINLLEIPLYPAYILILYFIVFFLYTMFSNISF